LLIEWKEIKPDDIIIIPAFGITVEVRKKIEEIGMKTLKYDTTCPFVEKVWNRASSLGLSNHTIIVHGKYRHEETRATFSHSKENAPTLIVRDIEETKMIGDFISGKRKDSEFYEIFKGKHSEGFNPSLHLKKIGVVNQTTMLAEETQSIADFLKGVMEKKYGKENIKEHFSDTRDTLCYATHDNQRAILALLEKKADIAIVVGGYNSSNTSHIVELCKKRLPTYFISSSDKLYSKVLISHFDIHNHKMLMNDNYLPDKTPATIILTSGASCPDSVAEEVLKKIMSYYDKTRSVNEVLNDIRKENYIR
jgi:4-hydroxy-3-methylbut-2-enyl diphosphate reductase